jgi:hypothetical protein
VEFGIVGRALTTPPQEFPQALFKCLVQSLCKVSQDEGHSLSFVFAPAHMSHDFLRQRAQSSFGRGAEVETWDPQTHQTGMMAAVCDPTAAAPAAATSSGLAGALRAGPGSSDGRATLGWPFTSRARQERAQQRAAAREESGSELGSDEECQDEPGHAVSTRGRDESGISDSEESSQEVSSDVVSSQEARENPPPVAAPVTVTAEMMAARYSAMFVIGAAEVQTSGQPPVGRKATKSLVKLATDHMNKVSDADIKALSNLFGNSDRRVGLGWLLGDAVRPAGSPLMERAAACAVGVKAQRVAAKIKTDVRDGKLAIQRELCKLATDDPRREALQGCKWRAWKRRCCAPMSTCRCRQ